MSARSLTVLLLSLLLTSLHSMAQDSAAAQHPFPIQPQFAEGLPVRSVLIVLHRNGEKVIADSLETERFQQAFGIRPGAAFRQSFVEMAVSRISREADIKSASYELYNANFGDPVVLVLRVYFLDKGELKSIDGRKGMAVSKSSRDFPVLLETSYSKVSFILNGGFGLFNESNAFFSKGPEFTQGNPVATDPATKGVRFWAETYLEPGISAITRLGKSRFYAYGAASALISARNTTDIYSSGGTVFADVERLYAGILMAGLGKNKKANIDISAGRQFFQLNDGFLLSKFSGSANAGNRGSVYLNSRTAFQKTLIARAHSGNWQAQVFFLEPEELFKDKQSNISYAGASLMYNNNKLIDAGLSYITISGGKGQYTTPQGKFDKKGMYIINPKLWLKDIASTGLFFKSEIAYQYHSNYDMRATAWYVGLGMKKNTWKGKPSLYYRYAVMTGDDSVSNRYEKFDPILTGGLGNWVQGINFRKIAGSGNIISHRIELKANFTKSFEASLDYFFLKAGSYSNLGALAPISTLKGLNYGQEVTLTARYFLSSHFMLLGVISYADPGNAVEKAFTDKIYPWASVQGALFMFF